jgi:hypothetical protein
MANSINGKIGKILSIVGEVVSQLLNVPILSGAMIVFIFFRLPTNIPNRISGFGLTLAFLCLIPLGSLFFYIPGKLRDWPKIFKRQRIASFVFMIVSYPIGFLILRLTHAPKIYEAVAATLVYIYGLIATPLLVLLPLVTLARLFAKGHDVWQTVVGALLSLSITVAMLWAYGFIPLSGVPY